jgi:hypothetical protein
VGQREGSTSRDRRHAGSSRGGTSGGGGAAAAGDGAPFPLLALPADVLARLLARLADGRSLAALSSACAPRARRGVHAGGMAGRV